MGCLMDQLPYILIAVITSAAVLYRGFDDNLVQRVGLSGVCIGAVLKFYTLLQASFGTNQAWRVLAWGLVIYAVGTYIKVRKHHRI